MPKTSAKETNKKTVGRSRGKRLWYDFVRFVCRQIAVVVFGIRVDGRAHMPAVKGGLVLANHQSHLDSIIVGLVCNRRLHYLARQTLFDFLPFRLLIQSLDAIPLNREGLGIGGLKATLKRLKEGELVLMFPEGTRSRDGEVGRIKSGFCALARRAGVPLVPVGIEGAFHAWPRTRSFPIPTGIRVFIGEPLLPSQMDVLDDDALVAELDRRIRRCHADARRALRRSSRHAPPCRQAHPSESEMFTTDRSPRKL